MLVVLCLAAWLGGVWWHESLGRRAADMLASAVLRATDTWAARVPTLHTCHSPRVLRLFTPVQLPNRALLLLPSTFLP